MNISKDTAYPNKPSKRSKPRLSASKKEEVAQLLTSLRDILGTHTDKKAHTVQIVFTSEKHESVLTFC